MSSSTTERQLDTPLASRKIFHAAVVVGSCAVLAKLGATARELVLARSFGRADALDAFLIAQLLPSFAVSLVAGSFGTALIPTFIHVHEAEGPEAAQRLLSSVMVWSLGLLILTSIFLAVLAPYYLRLLGSGFSDAKLKLAQHLLYLLLPSVVLSGLVVIWTAVLNARERFLFPAFVPVLESVAAILFLVLRGKAWGISAVAVGTIAGQGLEVLLLAGALKIQGIRLKPSWCSMSREMRQFIGQCAPLMVTWLIGSTSTLVDQSMAASLRSGSVAALNYGNRVVTGILGVGTMALSSAVFPYFSQMAAKQDWASFRRTFKTYSSLIVLVTVPITVSLVLFSHDLVKGLFERGAFTASDTKVVSRVLAFLSLQIPFYALGIMGLRVISALRKNSLLMLITIIAVFANIVFDYVFMRRAGVSGIALATSLVTLISWLIIFAWILVFFARRRRTLA
jgi:putative peptidoglycan lipid II flippase